MKTSDTLEIILNNRLMPPARVYGWGGLSNIYVDYLFSRSNQTPVVSYEKLQGVTQRDIDNFVAGW